MLPEGNIANLQFENIVSNIKSSDFQTCKLVYKLYYKPVYQVAYCIVNDSSLAEDIAHEVFLKMKHKIDQLQDPAKLKAWLCRIAINKAKDVIRKQAKVTSYQDSWERRADANDYQISPETFLLMQEDKNMIKEKINCLCPTYQKILHLKYYLEMSCEQISDSLDLPLGTVKSRLFHARKKIRELIELDS